MLKFCQLQTFIIVGSTFPIVSRNIVNILLSNQQPNLCYNLFELQDQLDR